MTRSVENGRLDRLGRRSRLASVALVVVMLALSGFSIWSTRATADATARAISATRLSDDFVLANRAIAAEEAAVLAYRVTPGPAARASFQEAAAGVVAAMGRVTADGSAEDRTFSKQVLAQHQTYVTAVEQLFTAIDHGETAAANRIANGQVVSSHAGIARTMTTEASLEHQVAFEELAQLQGLQHWTNRVRPAIVVIALVAVALLSLAARAYRRVLVAERAQAIYDSSHDPLTGLANWSSLLDDCTRALRESAGTGRVTGLLLIDLNRFQDINDTFGHPHGDVVLTEVGARLQNAAPEAGTVSRLGGDEFAVLLPNIAGLDQAMEVAATLRRALESPFRVEGVELFVDASTGVVISGQHGDDPATLLQRADVAMYIAKANNLGAFAYTSDTDTHTGESLALLGELRRGLERHELILHYQPKVAVMSGAVVGVEALLRWQHPTRGLIFPDEFLPAAEHTALIGPITAYVLDAALAQARRWADAGTPLQVSVNLSARNLLDDHLAEDVAERLAAHGVPARFLQLEVTETAIVTDPIRAHRLLTQLTDLGVAISIDDFGAGYTSLGVLKTLPAAELKIDRSFVLTMTTNRADAHIVRSIIDFAHLLGMTVVAEGVETPEILASLNRLGCDEAQGYHIARPATVDTFNTWTKAQAALPAPRRGNPGCRSSVEPETTTI